MLDSTQQTVIGQHIRIKGMVQGVGFRPYVWHLAQTYQLVGTVCNDSHGVSIQVWGQPAQLNAFIKQLPEDLPPLASIDHLDAQPIDKPCPYTDFQILASQSGAIHTGIIPDAAMCPACHTDILDPSNRRYRYPFTNCTHCGPRLSIVHGIPYDRANTSMAHFQLCVACQTEYQNPADRRFHAQPNACPVCGPQLWLEDANAQPITQSDAERDCIDSANRLLRAGKILAIMGIGGVHLACDASNEQAVATLRQRKQRYQKPFALMARDSEIIQQYAVLSPQAITLLQSKQAPIVLLTALREAKLAPSVAPQQTTLGFMLPYSPLHALLLAAWDTPLVMTSANISEEPQCISLEDTRQRLQGIADYWLLHNRPIVNRVDDSVVKVMAQRPRLMRRARGYAPEAIPLPPGFEAAPELLAMGGELKSTFALVRDAQVILSQHLGDLEDARTWQTYEQTLQLYQQLFQHQAQGVIVDSHPAYRSSQLGQQLATQQSLPLIPTQHHHAHIAACLAENAWPLRSKPVLGIVLDGLGYSAGELWGGELLLADYTQATRIGHFKPVAMPGGTQAILQPWRNLWAQLYSLDWAQISNHFKDVEAIEFLNQQPISTLATMLERDLNSPLSSSCGRLFDAVAAALDICRLQTTYEGQAAIELEALTPTCLVDVVPPYPFDLHLNAKGCWEIDPAPMWYALLKDLQTGYAPSVISAHFHRGIIEILTQVVMTVAEQQKITTIVLSGGVFQNSLLTQGLLTRLKQTGFTVLTHSRVPCNDGGLALGQAAIGAAQWLTSI